MSKESAVFNREESIKIFVDENGKEYLECPVCKRKFKAYLATINTEYSSGGLFPKTKCRDCSIELDGFGKLADEVHKILGN